MVTFLDGMKSAERPTGLVLGFVVNFVGFALAGLAPALMGMTGTETGTFSGQLRMTLSFALWIAVVFLWVVFRERRPLASLGITRGTWCDTMAGAVAGAGLTTLVVLLSVVTGQATLSSAQWSALLPVCLLLLGFCVQASAEEIGYRGYLVQVMGQRWPVLAVVLAQAVIFTAGHIGNGLSPLPIVCMLAVSYFLMMWILATGNLWGAMAFHTVWNWTQANVWGASVSNLKMDTHLFTFTPIEGSDLLTGGSFGLEGSLVTIILLLAGGFYFQRKWAAERRSSQGMATC